LPPHVAEPAADYASARIHPGSLRETAPGWPAHERTLPRVLVLLTAYNGARFIAEQIRSILAQRDVDLTVAVRDDGSADATSAEISRAARDARIRISATSGGRSGSAAQNLFTLMRENAAKQFDFVAFADQDDVWHEDKIVRACRSLAHTGAVGYSSATLAAWADGRERVLRQVERPTRADFLFEGAGQGCTFVLEHGFYARVRALVDRHPRLTAQLHYHDWAVYALARAWGLSWRFDSQPSMRYRQHEHNDTGARRSMAGVAHRLTALRQGFYRAQLCGIADLCATAAPGNATVKAWREVLAEPAGLRRRLRMTHFFLGDSRRRAADRVAVVFAALAGWI
jgi:rhamnosyltransferase